MFFKLYFWVMGVLTGISLPLLLIVYGKSMSLSDWRGTGESILILTGVYAYIYKKDFISSKNWSYIFWYLLVFWSIDLFYSLVPDLNLGPLNNLFVSGLPSDYSSRSMVIVSVLLGVPGLIAIYRLAYQESKKS